ITRSEVIEPNICIVLFTGIQVLVRCVPGRSDEVSESVGGVGGGNRAGNVRQQSYASLTVVAEKIYLPLAAINLALANQAVPVGIAVTDLIVSYYIYDLSIPSWIIGIHKIASGDTVDRLRHPIAIAIVLKTCYE